MRQYTTFLKKELLEGIRTYKFFIVFAVFVLFGIMSPLFAKLTPDLLASLMPEGMNVTIAESSATDSWMQFYKNNTQMGLIVITLLFSGILTTEISRGTLINMFTKGLSKTSVILSKFTYMILTWTLSIFSSFFITWGYTVFLFDNSGIHNLFFSLFCLWLFGVFLFAVLLLSSTLSKNSYGNLLLVGILVSFCALINIFPKVQKYNPISLISLNMDFVTSTTSPSFLYGGIAVTAVLTVLFLTASIFVFKKRQL